MTFEKYSETVLRYPDLGFSLDLSRMDIADDFAAKMQPLVDRAFADLAKLEAGEIANPDEGRMVGHYWLRNPDLAPNDEIRKQITEPIAAIKQFASMIPTGEIAPPSGGTFKNILIIGIGGSALGPQLINDALGQVDEIRPYFFDNTDPAGMDRDLAEIGSNLSKTLVVVISKSGGTAETRNGMLEAKAAYEDAGLNFAKHAIAVTGEGSKLDQFAREEGFITTFPMEDWVGGRTSILSTVGLVPMALQDIDFEAMLAGAKEMDDLTRSPDATQNAAMRLALAWHHEGNGKGDRDMVVLPYKDSLVLFSKYLQQLIMESLGKAEDLDGKTVNQGIAVYGNKGSTDQHAYVQQLRDGLHNFFATFIEVRKGREGNSITVEGENTSADYLQGFLRGTRRALYENGRHSALISIEQVNARTMGHLIALFERAVTFYASLVNINAYHQPGVEAGKAAANDFLELLNEVRGNLTAERKSAIEVATAIDGDPEDVFHCLVHLASNGEASHTRGKDPLDDRFYL
jgi:glucose-6-phosphate isomerase